MKNEILEISNNNFYSQKIIINIFSYDVKQNKSQNIELYKNLYKSEKNFENI